jgi:hypothetical protein
LTIADRRIVNANRQSRVANPQFQSTIDIPTLQSTLQLNNQHSVDPQSPIADSMANPESPIDNGYLCLKPPAPS